MTTISVTARRGLAAVFLTAAAAMVAACGSSGGNKAATGSSAPPSASQGTGGANGTGTPSSGSSAAPSTTPSGHGQPMLTACATSALAVTIPANQGGGAAGSTYVPIDFTNTSGRACEIYGFPGVSFVTARGGSQIGAAAARNTSYPSVNTMLASHATAHAWLQVAQAGNYPPSNCRQVTAEWLKVYPPGNTVATYVNRSFPACSSQKVNLLSVMPVRSGAGVEGKVP
ncbi:MAG TPA: DUF4232 domain-containing protein [Streptosporangiaceae bacterium]|nr:DUF4232 domain-containing protein [Streptosporangiaceae bacterium]